MACIVLLRVMFDQKEYFFINSWLFFVFCPSHVTKQNELIVMPKMHQFFLKVNSPLNAIGKCSTGLLPLFMNWILPTWEFFERAFCSNVSINFPMAKLVGCLFHFKQAARRKMIEFRFPDKEVSFTMKKVFFQLVRLEFVQSRVVWEWLWQKWRISSCWSADFCDAHVNMQVQFFHKLAHSQLTVKDNTSLETLDAGWVCWCTKYFDQQNLEWFGVLELSIQLNCSYKSP